MKKLPPSRLIDITGQQFERLTVIKRSTLEKRLKTKSIKDSFEKEIAENKSHPLNFEEWKAL